MHGVMMARWIDHGWSYEKWKNMFIVKIYKYNRDNMFVINKN